MSQHENIPAAESDAPKKKSPRLTKSRTEKSEPTPSAPEIIADVDWQRDYFARLRGDKAQIPRRFANKTLTNFETRDKSRKNLVENAGHFIKGFTFKEEFPKGLLMTGPVGCGKSHLAVAILREVIGKGYTGLYYNSPDLLRDIRATFDNSSEISEDEVLDTVTNVDLLVLDDLGAENVSGFVLDRFYLIVNKRYEGCKPMIVTTNLDDETLRARMGDRIVSRLGEMCARFGPFPNEDYRRRFLAE